MTQNISDKATEGGLADPMAMRSRARGTGLSWACTAAVRTAGTTIRAYKPDKGCIQCWPNPSSKHLCRMLLLLLLLLHLLMHTARRCVHSSKYQRNTRARAKTSHRVARDDVSGLMGEDRRQLIVTAQQLQQSRVHDHLAAGDHEGVRLWRAAKQQHILDTLSKRLLRMSCYVMCTCLDARRSTEGSSPPCLT